MTKLSIIIGGALLSLALTFAVRALIGSSEPWKTYKAPVVRVEISQAREWVEVHRGKK